MAEESTGPTHEVFAHTADVGLRVRAADLEGLFGEAACALTALSLDNPEAVEERDCVTFELAADRREDLLVDWLSELLCALEMRRLVFRRFEVALEAGRLRARAWGEPLDARRHRRATEVKAVTYHGLTLERTGEGWLAEVILDI